VESGPLHGPTGGFQWLNRHQSSCNLWEVEAAGGTDKFQWLNRHQSSCNFDLRLRAGVFDRVSMAQSPSVLLQRGSVGA